MTQQRPHSARGIDVKRILLAGGAIIAAAALIWFLFFRDGVAATGDLLIETSPVEARDISRIVSSSGAIAPLITVEVGSQLSGQVLELHADFNDQVTAGDLLARIDPQTFQTRVEEAPRFRSRTPIWNAPVWI